MAASSAARVLAFALAGLLLGCAVSSALEAGHPALASGLVAALDSSNFDRELRKHSHALVLFYSPSCTQSQAFLPEFLAAASGVKELDRKTLVALVDTTAEAELLQRLSVGSYPSVLWFAGDDKLDDYPGDPARDELVQWVESLLRTDVAPITGSAAFSAATRAEVCVLGYFEPFEGDAHAAYLRLAKDTYGVKFYKTADPEIAKEHGIVFSSAPGFVLFRNYSDHPFAAATWTKSNSNDAVSADGYAGDAVHELYTDLSDWMMRERLPDFLMYALDRLEELGTAIMSVAIGHHVYVAAPEEELESGGSDGLLARVREAGSQLRGEAVLLVAPLKQDGITHPVLHIFQLDLEDTALQVVGAHIVSGRKYRCDVAAGMTTAELVACARSVVAGVAPRIYSTGPPPEKATEAGVAVVVGSTVDAIAKDPSRDVLLLVNVPWSQACQAFEPTYTRLAWVLRNVTSVLVAKMDGSENQHADVSADTYPTLLLFPAGDKAAVEINIEQNPDVQALVGLVRASVHIPFDQPSLDLSGYEEEGVEGEEEEEEEDDDEYDDAGDAGDDDDEEEEEEENEEGAAPDHDEL